MDYNSSSRELLSDPGKVIFVLLAVNSFYVQKEGTKCNVPISSEF